MNLNGHFVPDRNQVQVLSNLEVVPSGRMLENLVKKMTSQKYEKMC